MKINVTNPKRLDPDRPASEPREDKPPKTPPKSAQKSKPPTPVQLERELRGLFEIVAGGLMFVDPATGAWTEQKAPELAKAWAIWAQKNAAVRRTLEALVAGGAAGNAMGVTTIWALGCYLIYLSRREALPPAWAMAAGIFGVPIGGNGAGAGGPVPTPPAPDGYPPGSDDVAGGRIEV